jgi:hypothetical protein
MSMKRVLRGTVGAVLAYGLMLAMATTERAQAEEVLFVSDLAAPGNYDIYSLDVDTGMVRRLTCDPGIDNHPDRSADGTKVVWSSTRTNGGSNPEGDFEIFVATDDGSTCGLENGTLTQLTANNYPDRHPHFNHDALNPKIIYTARYVCVATVEVHCVSECSMPRCITTIDPCGRTCEGMRVMDADGSNVIDIDHAVLTAANPLVWPARPPTDARWVGHPSFSPDDSRILFSGAVDGEGRSWEVYVADWDGSAVTNLRQVTRGSLFPPNTNPIKMSAGAHFAMDGAEILFTSTRTEFGNSQLFIVPAAADQVPVSAANRLVPAISDRANDYVPEPLHDGRIIVVSDREDYHSVETCCGAPPEYTADLNPTAPHTIRVEASGVIRPGSAGKRIHLDAYKLNGTTLVQETTDTTYVGSWASDTSPNASLGFYAVTDGTAAQHVDIAVSTGTGTVLLYLGRSPSSGVARIYIDGVPITDGNYALPGDVGANKSGWDLYTPQLATSNDLDLVIIDPSAGTQTNLTDNDFNDEMLLIGDEVSWFCGLSPNLSLCTYLPKSFTIEQLRMMFQGGGFQFPDYFPNKDLYPLSTQALNQFMSTGGNGLRQHNQSYWYQVMYQMNDPGGQYDDELVVLPAPVNYCVTHSGPGVPSGPTVSQQLCDVRLAFDSTPGAHTWDVYAGPVGQAPLLVGRDLLIPQTTLCNAAPGDYQWYVVARDTLGGLTDGPLWSFTVATSTAWQESFDAYLNDSQMHLQGCWHGWDGNPGAGALVTNVQAHSTPHSVNIGDSSDLVHEFCAAGSGKWKFTTWQFVPGNFQSGCDPSNNCGSYVILLNTYQDGGPYNWSAQLHADSVTHTFIRDGVSPTSAPLVTDRWVQIDVVVNLSSDSYQVFYDGAEVGVAESWTAGVYGGGGGALAIAALDLYANGSTVVYHDDISLALVPAGYTGDLNCDGSVNFGDINPFVLYLSNFSTWQTTYPGCPPQNGDINGDGTYPSFGDINPFVALLTGK